MNKNYTRRYFLALIISTMIFVTGFLASDFVNSKKLENLRVIEDNISLSIVNSETEYQLLSEIACDAPDSTKNTVLNREIGDLAEKLQILENNDQNDDRILTAKKRYSLLLIKDYLLSKKLSENCGTKPTFVIYFYGNADICPECVNTGFALSSLRTDYEKLRVYAFDYNLDLPLIKTFANIYGIKQDQLPAVIINNKLYVGLNNKDEIDNLLPKEVKNEIATSTKKKQSFNFNLNKFKNI